MSYHTIEHMLRCECCNKTWKTSDFTKVIDKVTTYVFYKDKELHLCADCGRRATKAFEEVYDIMAEGRKAEVSSRYLSRYGTFDIIDVDRGDTDPEADDD